MGQSRTALFLGVRPSKKLKALYLREDDDTLYLKFGLRLSECGKMLGIPFAVAYDPPRGCAELKFPIELLDLSIKAGRLGAAYERAMAKWKQMELYAKEHGISVAAPSVFLGEVETG